MTHAHHAERFHALDATRALALLLGVLFHIAWFFTPEPIGTPVKDVTANHFLGWFFHASHTFRMQVFFLIAGFFSRLLYQRRGLRTFCLNRFARIGIPFIIGWLVLFPLVLLVWQWGRNVSGMNGIELPPLLVVAGAVKTGAIFVPRSEGGAFGMAHLWFLYYLLWLYLLTIAGRALIVRTPLGGEGATQRIDRIVLLLTTSRLGPWALAALMTPLIWAMRGWFGVDTPSFSLMPNPTVIAVYLTFFLLGWFVHRQGNRLGEMFHPWRLHLLLGIAFSIVLYGLFARIAPHDATTVPPHGLTWRDVGDWDAFRSSLAEGANAGDEALPLAQLWSAAPPRTRDYLQADSLTSDQKYGILRFINGILGDPEYLTSEFKDKVKPPNRRGNSPASVPAHRAALQPHLAGVSAGDYREASWYLPAKLAFSAVYCLTMMFIVYGCLGAFQALCQGFSPAWRYLADSSYWVYLAHIPLVPALEVLIFDWRMSAWLKFPLLCVVSLAILYASYHYLVRSTFIGRALNGRAYPFHWNPLDALRSHTEGPAAAPLGGSPGGNSSAA